VYAVGDHAHRLDQVVLVDPEDRGRRGRWRLIGKSDQGLFAASASPVIVLLGRGLVD
jgi:hypothetical protein